MSDTQITPIALRIDNVARALLQNAKSNGIDVKTLDFNLLDTSNFIRYASDKDEIEWEAIEESELKNIDETDWLNPNFEIKQIYEIEIFTKEDSPLDNLNISIGANSDVTNVFLSIKSGSFIENYDDFENDLYSLVQRRLLRANIKLNIFLFDFKDVLKNIVSKVKVNGKYTFEETELINIAHSFDVMQSVDDELILFYEQKSSALDEFDRIDYAKRGFLVACIEDELLIKYIKPKKGKAGRDCRGKYIEPKDPITKNEPTFSVSEKIEIKEDDDFILYIAKNSGYITFEAGAYDIHEEVDIQEISFKTTGDIDAGIDADVSINVVEKDIFKDAVGMGMSVEVKEITIQGNVGPNARVKAQTAKIDGQTHSSSFVEADELFIEIHKGHAKGNEVTITRLEHGSVEANIVNITQALGGKVIAKEINIELCGSHLNLRASHKIEIHKLRGGENEFIIDTILDANTKENLENNDDAIVELERKNRSLKEELEKLEDLLVQNTPAFKELKKRLIHYKKNGVKMPNSFVKKYKEHIGLEKEVENLKQELFALKRSASSLHIKHDAFQINIMDARIINHDKWKNHNVLKFRMLNPDIELEFIPQEGSTNTTFSLVEVDDEFEIKAID